MRFDLQGPSPGSLRPGAAHVWCVSVAVSAAVEQSLSDVLSSTERERAARFVFDRDRRSFVASHAALRQILSRYTGTDPAALTFGEGERGKPWLRGDGAGALEFNLSHSGGFALVGVSAAAAIGVDIEAVRETDDLSSLARQCFAPVELKEWLALDPGRRVAGFFNAWTRKEAYIKATGLGLSCPLESFEVSLVPGARAELRSIDGCADTASAWTMHGFTPAPGVVAAAAIASRECALEVGWCWESGSSGSWSEPR